MSEQVFTEEDRREAIEHRDMLLDLRSVLATVSGVRMMRYLFMHLGVGELPEIGLPNDIMLDKMGYLRAGNAVFKLASEADPAIAGKLLAEIEKEKYERIYAEYARSQN